MKLTRTYAWYNGIPKRKTWYKDMCVEVSITTADEIQEHNKSPLPDVIYENNFFKVLKIHLLHLLLEFNEKIQR